MLDRAYEVLTARAYAAEVTGVLHRVLGARLRAVYLVGSLAWDDYRPGSSDVDIMAFCTEPLPLELKHAVARAAAQPVCPASGLELVLYTDKRAPEFELNLNTGPRRPYRFDVEQVPELGFWFVLDLAMARERAVALFGPPATEVVPPMGEQQIHDALHRSLDWHAEHDRGRPNAAFNAARAWRYAVERTWCSKSAAAAWAQARLRSRD